MHGDACRTLLTSIDFRLFHILPRKRVSLDDFGQCVRVKVFFTGLLVGLVLSGVLLHAFQPVGATAIFIVRLLEELSGLLPNLKHPRRWLSQHLCDP